jgi:hypothetical protein
METVRDKLWIFTCIAGSDNESHAALSCLPEVISYRLAGEDAGSWATMLVTLLPKDE